MKLKSITFVVLFGLWAAFTLAGSVWAALFMLGPNSITRLDVIPSDNMGAQLLAGLPFYLCGGGLWGWGIARLMNADAKSMVTACALSWAATGFAFIMAVGRLGVYFGGFSRVNILPYLGHSTHYTFLSIFFPLIGIITAINGYVITGKLGFHELKKSTGIYAGIAAALGFLAVGLILLYCFGWEVGRPVSGKYGMLKLMLFCDIGAALTGGMALGWLLKKSRIG
ncbi:MAG TPA: hypothetical protein VFY83_10530 [Anaerolineales bacterium]|nr:hypothetical protein [Anaerolineales bacterium]